MATNKAAVLPSKCFHPFQIQDAPMPSAPKANQVTIRIHAVAMNPVDMAMQSMGIAIEKYPCIIGLDCAGIVTAVGSEIKQFKVGDRVCGCVDVDDQAQGQGAFQMYVNLIESLTGKIPENISFAQAAVLPLGMDTACVGLFEKDNLRLDLPQATPRKPNGKAILVWGGSSSVGTCGIQAAKSAGYEVATTASAHNLDYCRSTGADHAFDYKTESVVEDVVKALKGKEFAGAFAAVMGDEVYNNSAWWRTDDQHCTTTVYAVRKGAARWCEARIQYVEPKFAGAIADRMTQTGVRG